MQLAFQHRSRWSNCIAHNAKGYDGQFILRYLHSQGYITPKVIPKGTELMMIEAGDIKIIDSLCFIPMALSKFPKKFGVTELKKGYFPHLFNCHENWHYIGPIPDVKFYQPDLMMPDDRELFLKWYVFFRKKIMLHF